MVELFRDTYRYRELILMLTQKELKVRYKRSVLGFLWALLHPLLMTGVYVMVFTLFIRAGRFGIEHYVIFLLCAMFPFTFFQQSLLYSVQCLINNGPLLQKVYVPKLVFPLAAVLANLVNFLLALVPLALFVLLFRHPFHATWLYLPVAVLAWLLFAAGCGLVVATISVFFHDVSHILEVFLRAYFFLCPVIYDLKHIDARYHVLLLWNPMLYILDGFRLPIFYGELPTPASIVLALSIGLLSVTVGYLFFRRYQDIFPLYV